MSKAAGGHWYRQPILWLGAAIFCASLAGCIGVIVLGAQYSEPPVSVGGEQVFKMPTARSAERDP